MKKQMCLAVMVSVALVGCVNDEVMDQAAALQQRKVTFNAPVTAGLTKVQTGEMPTAYDTNESFRVYAWYENPLFAGWNAGTGKLFMNNVKVEYAAGDVDTGVGSGAWFPGTDYYWPKNGTLTFAAYSPADLNTYCTTVAYGETGLSISGFGVPTITANQFDLLFSKRTYDQTTSVNADNAHYDGVNIVFQHALSSFKFTAKTKEDYGTQTTIKLKNISIYGVAWQADFAEGISDNTSTTYSATPKWENYSTTLVDEGAPYVVYNNTTDGGLTLSTTAASAQNDGVILLPQEFTTDNQAILKIEYSMQTGGAVNPVIDLVQTADLRSFFSGKWEIGKRYTFNLIFSLEKIYFAPQVEEWTGVPGSDVNL
ncbi:MAG: fimbrillin family protein [Bacteroidaceae bacterium]